MENIKAKPFIKWVGGKTQLISEIMNSLPKDLASRQGLTYVEPFVGGGAVLFQMLGSFPNIERAVINDVNAELVCTYTIVKERVEALISELERCQKEYLSLSEEGRKDYFLVQRARFNSHTCNDLEIATLFIFLNRTCFNGLYRVNSKGEFNVPFGRYANPRICDATTLRADSMLLQKVEIMCGDFAKTEGYAGEGTLFYFDPPYKPLTETSDFTSYAKGGFDDNEQLRLRDFCSSIDKKGSMFIASNSDPKPEAGKTQNFFDEVYDKFSIRRVYASRMINSNASLRGKLSELMITNIK